MSGIRSRCARPASVITPSAGPRYDPSAYADGACSTSPRSREPRMTAFNHRFDTTTLREYDIRGIVGKTLHPADAFAIGRCFGSIVARGGGKTVAVGRDGRLSSPELEPALVAGLSACGLEVLRVGTGPTPM